MDIIIEERFVEGVFNVSTGEGNSIKELFYQVKDYLGLKDLEISEKPMGLDDVKELVLDPKETNNKFGWRSLLTFQETINKQLKWYDTFGVNKIFSHLKTRGRDEN